MIEKGSNDFLKPENINMKEQEDFISLYRQASCKQIRGVYFDLSLLQDFYFGAILNSCHNEEEYKQTYDCIPTYNNRLIASHVDFFPWYKYTEEELIQYITQKDITDKLLKISPFTSMAIELGLMHRNTIEENRAKECKTTDAIDKLTYYVNTYPLKLTVEQMKVLKARFITIIDDSNIVFNVLSVPWYDIEEKYYQFIDRWYVDNLPAMIANDSSKVAEAMFKKLVFRDTEFYAEPRINNPDILNKFGYLTQDDFTNLERNASILMSMFCEFKFHRSVLVREK